MILMYAYGNIASVFDMRNLPFVYISLYFNLY